MALHIDPEIEEKYARFYDFALRAVPPCESETGETLVLEQLGDDALAAQVAAVAQPQQITCVMVRDCPQLVSLAALCALPNVEYVGVWRCKKLKELWNMSAQPRLAALVLVECKALKTLAPLADAAPGLCHFFLQGRKWSTPRLATLAPLPKLTHLVTCDLAVNKVSGGDVIYFEQQWPELEALTITPNLAKYFKRVKESS